MKQKINIGESSNDGTGDTLRSGAIKINQNFDEIYNRTDSMITGIVAGDGISVTSSFGQVTITNRLPSRGSFNTIEVAGEDSIETDQLFDTLKLVAGQNVSLATNSQDKSVTISVENLDIVDLSGDFTGTFTGLLYGPLVGDVQSQDIIAENLIRTPVVQISGDAVAAQSYYDSLVASKNIILGEIAGFQETLTGYEAQQLYWESQPPSQERTDQLILIQAQIDGVQLQIAEKEAELSIVQANISTIQPTLDTPYTSLNYNTITLEWSSNKKLSVPALSVGSITIPSVDGTANQVIKTNGTGDLSWATLDISELTDNTNLLGFDQTLNTTDNVTFRLLNLSTPNNDVEITTNSTLGRLLISVASNTNLENSSTLTFNNLGQLNVPRSVNVGANNGTGWIDGVDPTRLLIRTDTADIIIQPAWNEGLGPEWTYGTDGSITFPDGTVQTTAYIATPTLTVTQAPMSSAGQEGDKAGMIAVDNSAIYYCIADYDSLTPADIWVKQAWSTTGTW